MEEKKLTDEEIVKAIEHCESCGSCIGCPLHSPEYCKATEYEEEIFKIVVKQKAEIERLTEERENMQAVIFALEEDKRQLQKQVDELKESANGYLLTSLYKKQADDHKRAISVQRTHWGKEVKQAVKDTAKEILDELDLFFKGTTFRKGYEFKKIEKKLKEIAERKGVNVFAKEIP